MAPCTYGDERTIGIGDTMEEYKEHSAGSANLVKGPGKPGGNIG